MNDFWYNELKRRCEEIEQTAVSEKEAGRVLEAYDRLLEYLKLLRTEGILALEEAAQGLDTSDELKEYLAMLLNLVSYGVESNYVEGIGMNRMITMKLKGTDGLIAMMYLHGVLMIQSGCGYHIFEKTLQSCMPAVFLNELKRRESESAVSEAQAEAEADAERIRKLCEDDEIIDEKEHSIVCETAKTLLMMDDRDVQRLLLEISEYELTLAMKCLPGKARAKLLNNLSPKKAVIAAKNMELTGPVRMRDAENSCVSIMQKLIQLESKCEISSYDFSVIKIVLDMREHIEKENKALREKYQELHSIIDKIYRS